MVEASLNWSAEKADEIWSQLLNLRQQLKLPEGKRKDTRSDQIIAAEAIVRSAADLLATARDLIEADPDFDPDNRTKA